MRKIGTELAVLLGASLTGFCLYLGEHQVWAGPIPNCPQCSCKTVYAWWLAGNGTTSYSAQQVGLAPPNNTTYALRLIYVGASTESGPTSFSGNFDKWTWTTNTAGCDKIGGQWPSPQEVTPGGTGTANPTANRIVCTYNPSGCP
jgi:hypothetical protein